MDGVMFMHSRRLPLLRQVLDDLELVGPVRRISSQFSFRASDEFLAQNIRVHGDLEPLGCLGDLGWYNIRLSLWVCQGRLPERVAGRILGQHRRGGGQLVPTEFSGELFFPGGVSASFYCSFLAENQQWAHVSGTRGAVRMDDFVVPFYGCESAFEVSALVLHKRGCDFNLENHARRFAVHEYSNSAPDSQETNMIRTFAQIVLSRQLEPRWGQIALETQQVLDACLQSAREDGKLAAVI
jgi:predicted dehydrogenase